MQLMNAHTRTVVATEVEVADDRATRRKGLLGRDHLDPEAALVLTPCFSVHTAFMQFPIDVVFVDRNGIVLKVVRRMGPWRIAAAWGAHTVIELAAGAMAGARDVRVGDRLYIGYGQVPAESLEVSLA
jgi:uncharacterized membrane protein (UPF0127 family)